LKFEVVEAGVPFGVIVPDAGSVTVVGIPSTDRRYHSASLPWTIAIAYL
jgi:hypothetical protein